MKLILFIASMLFVNMAHSQECKLMDSNQWGGRRAMMKELNELLLKDKEMKVTWMSCDPYNIFILVCKD